MRILNEDVNNLFFGDFDIHKRLTEDIEAVKRQYSYIPEEDFEKIIRLDPTFKEGSNSVGKYGKWLLGLYCKDNPLNRLFISDRLAEYDSKKNDRNYTIEKDIGKFKSIADLASAIRDAEQAELSHRQDVRNRQQARKNANVEKDADIVYEDDDWKVYVPKTYEASCKLGGGTRWCTASTERREEFDFYTSKGPLYININKHNPELKYQFHFETEQFMDKEDKEIDIGDFLDAHPGLESFYVRKGLYTIPPKPDENGLLIYTGGKVAKEYRDEVNKVIVKDGVTSIGDFAFYKCSSLTSITIPSSVTTIGYGAFYYCSSLTSVTIPSRVTSIGNYAFSGCTSLTSIDIPSSVTSIGYKTFYHCSSLTSIEIPSAVTSIGDYAFFDCPNLTIRCKQGSYADKYAQENNIPVKYM